MNKRTINKMIVIPIVTIAAVVGIGSNFFEKQIGKQFQHNTVVKQRKEANLKQCNVTSYDASAHIVFTSGVNGKNEPGYDPANEGETITVDTFFLSNDRVFIDDTVNNRILIYKNGSYEKKINLEFKRDVKKMYYDEDAGILKAVYENREKLDATHYYLMYIDVTKNCIISEKEISNEKNILLEYAFNSDGELETNYYEKDETYDEEEVQDYVDELNDEDVTVETGFASDEDKKISICSVEDNEASNVNECILISKDGKVESYVVPDEHKDVLTEADVQMIGENVYQLKVDESELQIVQLTAVEITNDCLDYYSRELSTEENNESDYIKLLNYNNNDTKAMSVSSWSTLTAAQINSRIDDCYNCKWNFTKKNRDTSVCNYPKYVKQSCFLHKYPDPTSTYAVTNIPYCWGGYTLAFKTQIANGYYASNVCTKSDGNNVGYISKTAGLDCSGFVSRIFKLGSHYGTSQLTQLSCFTKRGKKENVKKNDILIAPGLHTLIVQKVYTKKGKIYMDTVEESKSFGAIVKRVGRSFEDIDKANKSGTMWPYKYKYLE